MPTVRGIAYVGLRLPDVEAATAYYERVLGLECVGPGLLSACPEGAVRLAARELALVQGEAGLTHLALEVDSFDGLPDGEIVDGTLMVTGPDGWRFAFARPLAGVSRRTGAAPFNVTRLGHVTFVSEDPKAAAAWCVERLGFRISEQLGEAFYWLRCNRDHHVVAFSLGPRAGLHHIGVEVAGWEDFRRVGDHFASIGQQIEYGPGRHSAGGNVFVYFLDPWGVRYELFSDLLRIDDESSYVAPVRAPDPLRSVNRWGPAPPRSFYDHVISQR